MMLYYNNVKSKLYNIVLIYLENFYIFKTNAGKNVLNR